MSLLLNAEEKQVVVFLIWKTLPYYKRFLISFGLILGGFYIQYLSFSIFPGIILIFIGNLFLLVRGYNNIAKLGKYYAKTQWEKTSISKLDELEALDKKMKKWDVSLLDISNPYGGCLFVIILAGSFITLMSGVINNNDLLFIVGCDGIALFLPHWISGIRSIDTKPALLLKVNLFKKLLAKQQEIINGHTPEVFLLLRGEEKQLPDDVKLRIKLKDQPQDFLGFYCQIVINTVKGTFYPYFYAVLVAKKNYGLRKVYDSFFPRSNIIKEYKTQDDVEVFVIRQETTKTSGYHTDFCMVTKIFNESLKLAEKASTK